MDVYRRALDELGKPMPEELPIRREVFVAGSREEAVRLCGPQLAGKYAVYAAWGQGKAMPAGDADLTAAFEDLARDRFLIGSADEVAEQMIALARATGVNHIVMSIQWSGMSQSLTLETLQRLAEDVFPKVREGL